MSDYTIDSLFMSMIVMLILMYAMLIANTPQISKSITNNSDIIVFNTDLMEKFWQNNKSQYGYVHALPTKTIQTDSCNFNINLEPNEKVIEHSDNIIVLRNKVIVVNARPNTYIQTNLRKIYIKFIDKNIEVNDKGDYIYVRNPSCYTKTINISNKTYELHPGQVIVIGKWKYNKIVIENMTFKGKKPLIILPEFNFEPIATAIDIKPYILQKNVSNNTIIFTTNIEDFITIIGNYEIKVEPVNGTIKVPIDIVPLNKTLTFIIDNKTITRYVILPASPFIKHIETTPKEFGIKVPYISTSRKGITINITTPKQMNITILIKSMYYSETYNLSINEGENIISIPYKLYNPIAKSDILLITITSNNKPIWNGIVVITILKPGVNVTIGKEQRSIVVNFEQPIFMDLNMDVYYYLDNKTVVYQRVLMFSGTKIFAFATPDYIRGHIIGVEYYIQTNNSLLYSGTA